MRSPFRAKHHVVVHYMARWMKCPLSPCPLPRPGAPPHWKITTVEFALMKEDLCLHDLWKTMKTRKNQRHYRQGTSHCSCLEHCFFLLFRSRSTFCDTLRFTDDHAPHAQGCLWRFEPHPDRTKRFVVCEIEHVPSFRHQRRCQCRQSQTRRKSIS